MTIGTVGSVTQLTEQPSTEVSILVNVLQMLKILEERVLRLEAKEKE